MPRRLALLGAVCLAVTGNTATAQDSVRSVGEATLTALDICALSALGGEVELGSSRIFFDLPDAAKERMPDIATFGDVPPLIKRFVETAEYSRQFGAVQITVLGADDGRVWIVETRQTGLCSVAITDVENKNSIQQSLTEALENSASWNLLTDSGSSDEFGWSFQIASSERTDGASARARVAGLASEFAVPDSIQVELNVRSVPSEARSEQNELESN